MKTPEEKKEAKRITNAKYVKNNIERVEKAKSNWIENNKTYNSDYYIKNKEEIKVNNKEYKIKNEDSIKLTNKEYYEGNKNTILDKMNERYLNRNKEVFNETRRNYYKEKVIIMAWRRILKSSLKRLNKKKEERTIDLLGYSALDLRNHLENLFTSGMSWDNHGEWHIDHIKPVSLFDKNTDVAIVNSLSNLQPLWASENIIKGNRY